MKKVKSWKEKRREWNEWADNTFTTEELGKALNVVLDEFPAFRFFSEDNLKAAKDGTLKFSELHEFLKRPVYEVLKKED